jgi:O-acetyl-ADP-ribose deacetylase (regulator of RNase III)
LAAKRLFAGDRALIKVGDITQENVDAIVNAANGTLMGGGGVDGAIHRAGGPEIKRACMEIRRTRYPEGLPTGQAVITTAGNLPARYVIHTVGPVYHNGGQDKADLLAACYFNSLSLAVENGLKTIAFPAISPGVYGYPMGEAAVVASQTIEQFLSLDKSIEEVRLVFFAAGDSDLFLKHHRFSG